MDWQRPCISFPGSYKVTCHFGHAQPAYPTLSQRDDMGVQQVWPKPRALSLRRLIPVDSQRLGLGHLSTSLEGDRKPASCLQSLMSRLQILQTGARRGEM